MLLIYISIALAIFIVQLLMVVKFFQMAKDLRFMRPDYEKLKLIHRLGEYSNARGERIYLDGEILFSTELNERVRIHSICDDGRYLCSYKKKGEHYDGYKAIHGDKLTDILPEE